MKECAVCGSTRIRHLVYGNHLRRPAWRWPAYLGLGFLSRLFFHRIGFLRWRTMFGMNQRIGVCGDCGYGRIDAGFSDRELEWYYSQAYWHSIGPSETVLPLPDDDRSHGQLAFVEPMLPSAEMTSLEIGAANALFSRRLKLAHKAKVSVVEPGQRWLPSYADWGVEHVGRMFPVKDTQTAYDYVHGSHWFEHTGPNLETSVAALRDVVKPNGLLFLEVPNCTATYWERDESDGPHIHFFTEAALSRTFENRGFVKLASVCVGGTPAEFQAIRKGKDTPESREKMAASIRHNVAVDEGDCLRMLFRRLN